VITDCGVNAATARVESQTDTEVLGGKTVCL